MQTVWFAPTNYVSGDPDLRISYPNVSHPGTVVQSQRTGDLKWIAMSLPLPNKAAIEQVIVCYQVTNSRSAILQVRVSEMSTPDRALVLHDDPTPLQSTNPVCYTSAIGGITPSPGGAVILELRLNFQNTGDQILLGAVGVAFTSTPPFIPTFNVKEFGAYGDGVHDDTAAITAAINASNAASFSGTGSIGFFSAPNVYFPAGIYLISASINAPAGTRIQGDQAIIKAANSTIDIFHPLNYDATIDNLIISGGHNAIAISNNNVGVYVSITNCQFHQQTGAVLEIDNRSQSSTVIFDHCKIFDDLTTGNVVNMGSGDDVFMHDCAMTTSKQYVFNLTGGNLTCRDILGVPNNGTGAWAYCNGGMFKAYRFRFGGESGGKVFVEWHTPPQLLVNPGSAYVPSHLVLEDCEIYSTTYAIKFYSLPGLVRCRGNAGDQGLIYWDSSIPVDQRQLIGRLFVADLRGNAPGFAADPSSDQQVATMMDFTKGEEFEHGNYVTIADRGLYIPAIAGGGGSGWGSNAQPTNLAGQASSDIYGEYAWQYSCLDPSKVAVLGQSFLTALDGLSTGPFTAVFAFEVISGTAGIEVYAAGTTRGWFLNQGRHVLDLPFWMTQSSLDEPAWQASHPYNVGDIAVVNHDPYGPAAIWRCVTAGNSGNTYNVFVNQSYNQLITDGTAVWEWLEDLNVGFQINLVGNSRIKVSAIRIYTGHVTVRGWRTVAVGRSVPVQGYWQAGDKILNAAPSAGGNYGWVCVAAGGASSGAWATNTPYTSATCVLNNGVVYQCMKAGQSASSGNGPSGSAGTLNITDGSAIWNAIANSQAVFKSFGAISP